MGYFYAISSLAGRFSVAYSYDGGLCGGALKYLLALPKEQNITTLLPTDMSMVFNYYTITIPSIKVSLVML